MTDVACRAGDLSVMFTLQTACAARYSQIPYFTLPHLPGEGVGLSCLGLLRGPWTAGPSPRAEVRCLSLRRGGRKGAHEGRPYTRHHAHPTPPRALTRRASATTSPSGEVEEVWQRGGSGDNMVRRQEYSALPANEGADRQYDRNASVPDRERHDGGDGGARGRLLGRVHAARRPQLPHQQPALPARLHPHARPHQARRGADERIARPARPGRRRQHRGRRERGGRREVGRALRRGPLPDRLRHVDQHERERGHRAPRTRTDARRERPPERPRQHGAVVQRRDPDGEPPHRRRGAQRGAHPGARTGAGGARGQVRGVLGHHQDRQDAPAGRDAHPARSGVRRVREPAGAEHRAPAPARRGAVRGRAGRHRGRHRHQRARGVRRADVRVARRGAGAAGRRDGAPLPGAGHAGHDARGERGGAQRGGLAAEDRERPAVAVVGALARGWRSWNCRRCSRARRSCRAR